MTLNEIILYFTLHRDHRLIPNINYNDWLEFIKKYPKEDIKLGLAKYITENQVPFPLKEIKYSEFAELFTKFAQTSMLDEYKNFQMVS